MKRSSILVLLSIAVVFAILGIGEVVPTSAKQSSPTPNLPTQIPPTPTLSSGIEERISKLEIAQSESVETLKLANEYNRNLSTFIGAIISIIVVIQSIVTYTQLNRESKLTSRQVAREDQQDFAERAGVNQVSKILSVVQQTLESRLIAEEQARTRAIEAETQLAEVTKKFERLDVFYQNFQSNIRKLRAEIESDAFHIATTVGRHDFRGIPDKLNDFANRFDRFMFDYEPIEEDAYPYSPQVPYIRGIAAHYVNQPEIAEKYLKQVVSNQVSAQKEELIAFNRRVANSYYYLGLNESNFGDYEDAIRYFDEGNKLDSQSRDFLTKIVIAEAYVMLDEFAKADQFLSDIQMRMQEIELIESSLRTPEIRLKSRVALIKANMLFLRQTKNWQSEVQEILHPVHEKDPLYYYITATLAQAYHSQGSNEVTKELFRDVYSTILNVADIHTIREVRSKILLLMIAGIASKYVLEENQAKEYLDQAETLCESLPKIGNRMCTVFSTLSKRNESSDVIKSHILLIRNGAILLSR